MGKTAHCACGALQAEVTCAPDAVVVCHCTDCQRRTGSVIGVGAYYPKAHVKITGESKEFVRVTAAGRNFHEHFCPTCGTTLFFFGSYKPDSIGIAVGAFADPTFPAPVRSVWEQSHHPWVGLPDGLQHFPRGRDTSPQK